MEDKPAPVKVTRTRQYYDAAYKRNAVELAHEHCVMLLARPPDYGFFRRILRFLGNPRYVTVARPSRRSPSQACSILSLDAPKLGA